MRRSTLVLSLVQCVAVLGYSIVLPGLPEMAHRFRLGVGGVGFVLAAHAAAAVLGGVVLRRMSERWGRKAVLVGAGLLMAESLLVLAWAGDVFMLYLARIAAGFAAGIAIVADASMADLRARESHVKGGGWPVTRGGYGVGFVLGALLIGILGGRGQAAPAYAAAALAVVSLVAVISLLPETLDETSRAALPAQAPTSPRVGRRILREPLYRLLVVSEGAYAFGLTVFVSSFALVAVRRFGLSLPQRGYLLAFVGLAAVVADALGTEGPAPTGKRLSVLLAAAVASAALLYAWPLAPTLPLLMATTGLAASAIGVTAGSTTRISAPTRREEAAVAAEVGSSVAGWMRVFASLAATLLVALLGVEAPGVVAALVMAALAVYVASVESHLRARSRGRPAPTS